MNILFYHTSPLLAHHFGVLMDEAEIFSRKGHIVNFAICDGAIDICFSNPRKDPSICKICKLMTNKALKNLSKKVNIIKLSKYKSAEKYSFNYNSVDEIKQIKYKKCNIGYAVLSAYITMTRNGSPKINDEFKCYFDKTLAESCKLTDILDSLYTEINPDLACLFNGRFYEQKPFYDLAIQKNINVRSYEVIGGYGEPYYKVFYDNITPHNILGNIQKVENLWNSSELDNAKKENIGKTFFENRRNGIPACDVVYTNKQVSGCLPKGWDNSKRNIVIFNSSEDEYASIGDEYEKLSFYKTQIEGIKSVLELTKDNKDIHFYLRIHPNLSNIKYRYHTDLLSLDKQYENVTIIPGHDKTSSYDLMDKAEKIIVFGSTMGLEAAYWNKPVILLSGAFYYHTNLCYKPHNKEELYSLITSSLLPLDNKEAIKFGFYYMFRNPSDTYKYIDYNWQEFKIFNKKFIDIHYLKLLGSSKLYALYISILRKLTTSSQNNSLLSIPMKEELNTGVFHNS